MSPVPFYQVAACNVYAQMHKSVADIITAIKRLVIELVIQFRQNKMVVHERMFSETKKTDTHHQPDDAYRLFSVRERIRTLDLTLRNMLLTAQAAI